jgi:hypothetical protein
LKEPVIVSGKLDVIMPETTFKSAPPEKKVPIYDGKLDFSSDIAPMVNLEGFFDFIEAKQFSSSK